MNNEIRVACAVIRSETGEVLLCQRSQGRKEAGFWEFPGGKIEAGETGVQALHRELYEELELECAIQDELTQCSYAYTHGLIRLVAYECRILSGNIRLKDHDAFAWVAPIDLLHYPLAPADIAIAQYIAGID
jgi:8-oxo-dGTP diphosphatase